MRASREKQSNQTLPLLELPVEILSIIFNYMNFKDFAILQLTSRRFKKLLDVPLLWKNLFERRFNLDLGHIPDDTLILPLRRKNFYLENLISLLNVGSGEYAYRVRNMLRQKLTTLCIECISILSLNLMQWQALKEVMTAYSNVKSLKFNSTPLNKFDSTQWRGIATIFDNPRLSTLTFDTNYIGQLECNQWASLCEALKKLSVMTTLELSYNNLSKLQPVQWQMLINALNHTKLTKLILLGASLSKLHRTVWPEFIKALKNTNLLKSLDLSLNNFRGECKWIVFFIQQNFSSNPNENLIGNFTLQEFYLKYNKIDDQVACLLAEALKTNHTLKLINLNYNNITDTGAVAIADSLKSNTSLNRIFLANNIIGDEGAIAIAQALKINFSLLGIKLGKNRIGDKGAKALADALNINSTLLNIDLANNSISTSSKEHFFKILRTNITLQEVSLSTDCLDEYLYDLWSVDPTYEKRTYLLTRNNLIKTYPLHTKLIRTAIDRKVLGISNYSPLPLRTLCGIYVLRQENSGLKCSKIKTQALISKLPDDLKLLLTDLNKLNNKLCDTLHCKSISFT